ncbi:FAD-dependent oxidoreductase [Paraburkholderia pallida]
MRTGAKLGFQSVFLDRARCARGIPPALLFGNYVPRGGALHPGKYVRWLRRVALRPGVTIYENTSLLSYTEGPLIKGQTPRQCERPDSDAGHQRLYLSTRPACGRGRAVAYLGDRD